MKIEFAKDGGTFLKAGKYARGRVERYGEPHYAALLVHEDMIEEEVRPSLIAEFAAGRWYAYGDGTAFINGVLCDWATSKPITPREPIIVEDYL